MIQKSHQYIYNIFIYFKKKFEMEKKILIPLNQLIDSSEYENINEEEKVNPGEEIDFKVEELDPFDQFYSNPQNRTKALNNNVKLNNTKFKREFSHDNNTDYFREENLNNNRYNVYLDNYQPKETNMRPKNKNKDNVNESKIKKLINLKKEIMSEEYLNKIGLENSQCPICLCSIDINEEVSKLKCGLIFHFTCLDKWVDKKKECPFCRSKIIIKHSKTYQQPIYANEKIIKNNFKKK